MTTEEIDRIISNGNRRNESDVAFAVRIFKLGERFSRRYTERIDRFLGSFVATFSDDQVNEYVRETTT